MASLLFKRFFEIRILHEYYFMQADGTSLFDRNRSEWDKVLADQVVKGKYTILNDLTIEPTEECRKILNNHHIRFAPKPTGFILGIEVKDEALTTQIAIDRSVIFQFLLKVKNPNFRSFTNEFSRSGSYFFSNRSAQLTRVRNAPVLSNTIADFTKKKVYKMGELARKAQKLQLARKTTNSGNAADWMPLSTQSGQNTYVNTQDTCQFRRKYFQYQVNEPIGKIEAKLFAEGISTPLKTISLTLDSPAQTVPMDFTLDDYNKKIGDGLFLLTISYNDKPEESEMIYFSDSLAQIRPYALIEISMDGQGGFKIINDGKLVRDAAGKQPIFELLFKSRATYWRYRSNYRKKLYKPSGYDFLVEKDPDLVTVDPRRLSAEASSFQRNNNGVSTPVFLPSPDVAMLQQDDDVFYSDVFVSKL